jgi:hypothetical protein
MVPVTRGFVVCLFASLLGCCTRDLVQGEIRRDRHERDAVEREPGNCSMVATTREPHDRFTGAATPNAAG